MLPNDILVIKNTVMNSMSNVHPLSNQYVQKQRDENRGYYLIRCSHNYIWGTLKIWKPGIRNCKIEDCALTYFSMSSLKLRSTSGNIEWENGIIKCAICKITDVRHEQGSFNSCAISDMTQTFSRNAKIIKKMIMILRCDKNSSGKDLVT